MRDFALSDDAAVQAQLDRLGSLSVPQGRLGLETITALLDRLGNPHRSLPPVFHVAGTNGKGSTCAFLRAMLEADGKRVHVTTSPHLVRYNERIRLAGELISDKALAEVLAEVLDAGKDLGPSFFEVTIAAAFLAFSRVEADACVVEVGLGGRFDATNVLGPEVLAACGIAALGLDHERFLLAHEAGTPEEPIARIAFEKAGIAKPGVPLVTQAYLPHVSDEISRRAALAGSPLYMRGESWAAASASDTIGYRDEHGELSLPLPVLPGAHQIDNAVLAVALLRHQNAVSVSDAAVAGGMRSARWPARLQVLSPGPITELAGRRVLIDGGHNPDAAQALAAYIARTERPVDAVIGMLANKDSRGFIEILAPQLASLVAIPVPGHEYAAPLHLAKIAHETGVPETQTADHLEGALDLLPSRERGTVLIGGSLYLAGTVLSANREYPD